MPELPEVETIARALRQGGRSGPAILGRVVRRVQILWARSIAEPQAAVFAARLAGQTVREIGRRGKFILIGLDADTLLVHLRMSGDLRVEPAQDEGGQEQALAAHDRVVFDLDDGLRLAFNDARKFGRLWLVEDPQSVTGGLGPEPLEDAFTPAVLYRGLQGKRRQLKPLLLDQSFLSGLGNIYTDEALHLAGLHPNQSSERVTAEQAASLWQAIRHVLQEGIQRNGASIDWVYRGGGFQNNFRVYRRTGQPCLTCGTPVVRRLVGQRSTHFCPVCQKEEILA
jgi:formamidopyrimidine-DNA glycosylase